MFLKRKHTILEKLLICSLIVLHINLILPLSDFLPLPKAVKKAIMPEALADEPPAPSWLVVEIHDGLDPSLAIDSSSKPHISFGKDDGSTSQASHIFYANKESSTWSATELAAKSYSCGETSIIVDTNNKIHIAYANEYGQGVWHLTNSSGSWTDTLIVGAYTGNYESFVMDDNGRLHVCYWNNWNRDDGLQLNYKSKGISDTWASQPLGTLGRPSGITIYADSPIYKAPTAMALTHGANPTPHIIAGINSGKLRHYWKSGTSWPSEDFAYGYELSFDPNGTMQFDSNNTLYCVLVKTISGTKSLILAKNVSGTWSDETIVQLAPGSLGRVSLVIDSQDTLHIAYFSGQKLYYATKDGTNWISQEVTTIASGVSPEDLSLALNLSGWPRIAYSTTSATSKKIWYAEWDIPNKPPDVEPIPPKTINENELLTFDVVATPEPGETLTYSLVPKNYPDGAILNSSTGVFTWTPTYKQAGYYETSAKVSDGRGGEASEVIKITVINVNTKPTVGITPSTFCVTTGTNFTLHIDTNDGGDGDTLTYVLKENGTVIQNGTIVPPEQIPDITRNKTTIGIYTYTVTVSDPDSESATASCSVEVIDASEDPADSFPISGDFNGDGMTDIGTFNTKTGNWKVALSDKGKFNSIQSWMSDFKGKDYKYAYSLTGDFNGDGRADIVSYDRQGGVWKFAFSDGTKFTHNIAWDLKGFGGGDCSPLIGDFNGDGITDIGYADASAGNSGSFCIRLAKEDRTGFKDTAIPYETGLTGGLTYAGDFNGDGLTDIVAFNRSSGEWKVLLSQDTTSTQSIDWVQNAGTTYSSSYGPEPPPPYPNLYDGDWDTGYGGSFGGHSGQATEIAITTFAKPINLSYIKWRVSVSAGIDGGNQGGAYWYVYLYYGGDWHKIGDGYSGNFGSPGSCGNDSGEATEPGPWVGVTQMKVHCSAWADAGSNHSASGGVNVYELQAWGPADEAAAAGSFPSFTSGATWIPNFGKDKEPIITDYNHDGKTDIGYFDVTTHEWYYALSDGSAAFSAISGTQWPTAPDFAQGTNILPSGGDYNGDGIGDASVFHRDRQGLLTKWEIKLHNSKQPDFLVSINNGIGGTTNIGYEVSTQLDNTGGDGKPDLPFPLQVVKKETKSNGMGNSYSINYEYSGGMFEPNSREFRGFKHVKVIDAEGTVKETEFYQGDVLKGKPIWEEVIDDSGKVYSTVSYEWQEANKVHGGLCDFPYMISQTSTVYNHTAGTSRDIKTLYSVPDAYGNVLRIDELGFVDDPTDDRYTTIEYEYNTASYIVGKPKHTIIMKGGTKAAETWYRYDAFGSLKKEEKWLDTGEGNLITKFKYDYEVNPNNHSGNLIEVTDALSRTTTTTYDASYEYTFPVQVTNTLGHTQNFTYDKKTGQILTSTNPNGQKKQTIYDNFGRTLKVIGPNDTETSPGIAYIYDLSLQPVKITTITKVDVGKTATSYAFIDGLGRTIEVKTEAEEAGKQLISGVVKYDSRGQVQYKYLPYFATASSDYLAPNYAQLKITYVNDPVGRAIQTIRTDNISSFVQYDGWIVTATDENGHKITQEKDAFGRSTKVTEYNGAETYLTQYQYDTLGNLTKTIDSKNNETSITYDSLGRKRAMDDLDMGHWEYGYDGVGNLIWQEDAKHQIVGFKYDLIDRLEIKSKINSRGEVPTSGVVYTYDVISPSNPYAKGRLTKVTDSSGKTEFFYDNLGREIKSIKTVDAVSYAVERTYDSMDRLKTAKYPDGETLTYTYNKAGGVETVSSPVKAYVTNIDYNENGQMTKIEYGNGTHTDYTYNLETLRLENLLTVASSGNIQNLTYAFDNVGNVLSITDASNGSPKGTNTQSFQYDDLNRLSKATGASYGVINYSYDSIGNMTKNADITLMEYGVTAGPHAVTHYTKNSTRYAITYDANGNMISKETETGTKSFKYDIENRLIEAPSQGSYISNYTISLNPGWNFVSLPVIVTEDIATILAYSGITKAQISRYNSDTKAWENFAYEQGKDLSEYNDFTTFDYGRGYEIYVDTASVLKVSGTTPTSQKTLDLKTGWNLITAPTTTSIDVAVAFNGITYSNICERQGDTYIPVTQLKGGESYFLKVATDQTWNIPSEGAKTTYVYDGDGGRVKVITSEETTTYIGSTYEVQSTGAGTKISKHIFLGQTRICTVENDGTTTKYRYYHQDHIGSSNVITDETGAIAKLIEYSPYGLTSREEGAYNTNCKFTGKLFDTSTALYYYGARYYDPELGRFIQPDTIVPYPADPQSFNRYAYARNNPIKYVDPTGHSWWDSFKKWIGHIVGAIVGVVVGVVTGNFWLGFQAYSFTSSIVNSAVTGNWGGLAGGIIGGLVGGALGWQAGVAGAALLSDAVPQFVVGFTVGAIEFGASGLGSGFGSAIGSGADFGDAVKAGLISGGISAIAGGLLEGSYRAGWQSWGHGASNDQINAAKYEIRVREMNDDALHAEWTRVLRSDNGGASDYGIALTREVQRRETWIRLGDRTMDNIRGEIIDYAASKALQVPGVEASLAVDPFKFVNYLPKHDTGKTILESWQELLDRSIDVLQYRK